MISPDKYNFALQEKTLKLAEHLRKSIDGFYYGLLIKQSNISPGVCFRGNKKYCELSLVQIGTIHNTQAIYFNVGNDGVRLYVIEQDDIEYALPRKICKKYVKFLQDNYGIHFNDKKYEGNHVHDWFTDYLSDDEIETVCRELRAMMKDMTYMRSKKLTHLLYDEETFKRLLPRHTQYTMHLNEDGTYEYIKPDITVDTEDDEEGEVEMSDDLKTLYEQLKKAMEDEDFELVNEICHKIAVLNAVNDEPIAETDYTKYLRALRTKPFLLLAGISGTGKSRIVREMAYKSCPPGELRVDKTTPGNYLMVEVKPNWHDSSELLGYYSNINKGYVLTPFVRFLVKAKKYPNVPFFVCLDEMNLAPVEQYFAEFLSLLETRRKSGEKIKSGVLVEKKHLEELGETEDLTLPQNVFIVGTVNMDDTTHQFSRKVIDRAMTIEMNGGNMEDMFGHSSNLDYTDDVWTMKEDLKVLYVSADEVVEQHKLWADKIKKELPSSLNSINKCLKNTPFEVSYRVLNELVIYLGVLLDDVKPKDEDEFHKLVHKAIDQILLMKILPRIEGDSEMFNLSKDEQNETDNRFSNKLKWLQDICPEMDTAENEMTSKKKLEEMLGRLNSGFTRYWP